jgi:hypothetical protein
MNVRVNFSKYSEIVIFAPSGVLKGGGESLILLLNNLKQRNIPASIQYVSNEQSWNALRDFDAKGKLLIFPEIYITKASSIMNAHAAIWWLSVDNFTYKKHASVLRDMFTYYKNVLRGRRPLRIGKTLHPLIHFCESHYAIAYLKSFGINSIYLPRLLGNIFYQSSDAVSKEKIIACSRRKGRLYLDKVIKEFSDFDFIFLDNLSEEDVYKVLARSMVYLDLGHFPGSERLPREAVMLNNFVLINNVGAAQNFQDFPLPSQFKLNVNSPDFYSNLRKLLNQIFDNEISFSEMYEFQQSIQNLRKNYPEIINSLI